MSILSLNSGTKQKLLIGKFLAYSFLILLAILSITPFYIMLVNATRSNADINYGPSLLPSDNLWENIQTLLYGRLNTGTGSRSGGLDIPRGFLNSTVIAVSATLLTSYFSALTAYAFVIYNFKGKKVLFGMILATIMIPPAITLVGFYKLIVALGMHDTFWPLILPSIANVFAVFFLRNYLQGVLQRSLVEAARIDGAGELRIFHKIILPIASPGIATMAIFSFITSWNNYLLPLLVLNSNENYTMPLLIQQLNTTTYNRDLGALYLGVAISVVPIMIAFAFFSRYMISGIIVGGLKE